MNKSELVQQLASRADLSRAEATKAVDALFSVENGIIAEALRGGDKVQITGFGSFETKKREARTGRNPRTGESVSISEKVVPVFKTGKEMRQRLNAPAPKVLKAAAAQ